jgi:hypothetical protein
MKMYATKRILALVLTLLLAACHGSKMVDTGAPRIVVQPRSVVVIAGETATFDVSATGDAPLSYQWQRNGTAIDTGTSSSYTTAPATLADDGTSYAVSVSNAKGTVTSLPATLLLGKVDTSILPPERATLWNPGLNAVGGIPTTRAICGDTEIQPNGSDDTDTIQKALDTCPDNTVVQLGEGTFNIVGTESRWGLKINRSNITLRGKGRDKTKLLKNPGSITAVIYVGAGAAFVDRVDLVKDGIKGSYTLTVAGAPKLLMAGQTVPGYQPGELVAVSQSTDPDIAVWSYMSPRGAWSRCWFNDCNPEDASAPNYDPEGRPTGQVLEVQSVSGSTLTFTTPLHTNYLLAYGARLARISNSNSEASMPVKYSGIEDLYVAQGEGGDYHGNIAVTGTAYCWIKNIESDRSIGTSVGLYFTFRNELRDSYLHSTAQPEPGGGGYGIGLNLYAADNLVENNISWAFNKVMVMRAAGGGNVIGYNYMEDGYIASYPTGPEIGLNAAHFASSNYELFEGNESFNFATETYWGNSAYITAFRNHMTGLRRGVSPIGDITFVINAGQPNAFTSYYEDIQGRRIVAVNTGAYYYTFVGNVLGYSGMNIPTARTKGLMQPTVFVYSRTYPSPEYKYEDGSNVPMWSFAIDMTQLTGNDADQTRADDKVLQTLLRDGNFDYFSGSVKWDRAVQPIPKSLYLAEKPVFFGDLPWPWVTPEDAQTTHTLPARDLFDSIHGLARGGAD